jgi:hypothetical protein
MECNSSSVKNGGRGLHQNAGHGLRQCPAEWRGDWASVSVSVLELFVWMSRFVSEFGAPDDWSACLGVR